MGGAVRRLHGMGSDSVRLRSHGGPRRSATNGVACPSGEYGIDSTSAAQHCGRIVATWSGRLCFLAILGAHRRHGGALRQSPMKRTPQHTTATTAQRAQLPRLRPFGAFLRLTPVGRPCDDSTVLDRPTNRNASPAVCAARGAARSAAVLGIAVAVVRSSAVNVARSTAIVASGRNGLTFANGNRTKRMDCRSREAAL